MISIRIVPRRRRIACAAMIAAGCAAAPLVARAFTEPRTYYDDPRAGGGGGRWFTGSPAEGHGCSVCHGGAGVASLEVDGLPTDGYVPGERYDVRLAWPRFAERADTLRARDDGPPSMGLVAELVAETGRGAGAIEIAAAEAARADELCVVPEGAPAAQLFGVRPVDQTSEEGTHCDANALGQRCLVAVLSCGAREVRMRWTAPEKDQGTIWFAAGFVTTEHAKSDVRGDAVVEVAIPIAPARSASQRYETRLHGACGAAAGSRSHGSQAASVVTLCLALGMARSWARRRTRRVG
jgi:hypothetical protein